MAQQVKGCIVLGSDFKALGVIRSLGRRGIPCVVIDNQPRSAWLSRYAHRRFHWQSLMEGEKFLHFLLRLAKMQQMEGWALFPAQDEAVEFVSRYCKELTPFYRLVTQDWNILQLASNKRQMNEIAEAATVPYPQTCYPTGEADLDDLEIRYPCIIKPTISVHMQYSLHVKALPAADLTELKAQYRLALTHVPAEELMIQEIVPGHGESQFSEVAFCKDGTMLLSMTARRTRQYPIDYGLGSSFVEAIEVPEIHDQTVRLLKKLALTGMVEVEYKYDHRDGLYKLLDINVRPWGWHTLCAACGLDFPYIQYQALLGYLPEPTIPRYGARWWRPMTDIPAGIQEVRAHLTTPQAYLKSLWGQTVFSVHNWSDPLPSLADGVSAITRYLKRRREA